MSKVNIKQVAKLANIPINQQEVSNLQSSLEETLDVISNLKKINTSKIKSTFQVTGLRNVFREDKINKSKTLTQKQALSNAKKTFKGYFVVPNVFS